MVYHETTYCLVDLHDIAPPLC